jgi:hypothetical protein
VGFTSKVVTTVTGPLVALSAAAFACSSSSFSFTVSRVFASFHVAPVPITAASPAAANIVGDGGFYCGDQRRRYVATQTETKGRFVVTYLTVSYSSLERGAARRRRGAAAAAAQAQWGWRCCLRSALRSG